MAITMGLFRAAGAFCILAAMTVPGGAQSVSQNGTSVVTGSTPGVQDRRDQARKQTKSQKRQAPRTAIAPRTTVPGTTVPGTTVPGTAASSSGGQPWSIEQALPTKPAARQDVPRLSTQNLGRVPLETGSFGIETKSQFRQNEFSDGRKIPGLEATKRQDPSYFGLSLQVPTNNVPLLPLLSPPINR